MRANGRMSARWFFTPLLDDASREDSKAQNRGVRSISSPISGHNLATR
jgi:hypothetical protein